MKHEITVPEVGESISEVVLAEWLRADGDYVDADEVICEIESDKASFEVPADQAGVLETKAEAGDTVAVGAVLAVIDTAQQAETAEPAETTEAEEKPEQAEAGSHAEEQPKKPEETKPSPEEEQEPVRVSPVASNILKEAGIPPGDVQGSGVGGKITKADAQRALEEAETKQQQAAQGAAPAPHSPPQADKKSIQRESVDTGARQTERKRMSTLRKTIADRLVSAKNDTAMLTTFNEFDMSAILALRKEYKEKFAEAYDVRLGFMSFFIKACIIAIDEFPEVNASIDGEEIVYHNYVDVGIAVSTDRGLVVPVVRNAESKSFAALEEEVSELAEKARENSLAIEEMRGGTFTITNGGVFGSLMSTPILNSPQSAILGMHKIEERPIALNGEVVIRPMMYVAMSYDHRIIDGKETVQFLVRVKELIENPVRMLLKV